MIGMYNRVTVSKDNVQWRVNRRCVVNNGVGLTGTSAKTKRVIVTIVIQFTHTTSGNAFFNSNPLHPTSSSTTPRTPGTVPRRRQSSRSSPPPGC